MSKQKKRIKNKRVLHFIKMLKALDLEARRRQEIFFTMNLRGFKNYKIRGGK